MGNCIMRGSSSSAAVWAGDDWGEVVAEEPTTAAEEPTTAAEEPTTAAEEEKKGLLGGEVRIRISKKQLEELLRKVEKTSGSSQMNKMKAGQILQNLIDKSDHFEVHHLRHWKPALQSIPEVDCL